MITNILLVCVCVGGAWCDLMLPTHIKFGAGSSAWQNEGGWDADGKTPSILDTYFRSNRSKLGSPGEACKSYEYWKRDVEIAKELGLQFYRFSFSWPRILPNGFSDNVNEAGVNYYNNLINELLANGIEPVVTLLHFDLPQCLQDLGGFGSPDFPVWFADYARTAYTLFGDRVKIWITMNEPLHAIYRFAYRAVPEDQFEPYLYAKNMMLGHAKAYRVYDEEFRTTQNGMVSLVSQLVWMYPATPEDKELAELTNELFIGIFSHPIFSKHGGWPKNLEKALAKNNSSKHLPKLTKEEIEFMKGTYDYYGLNYYSSKLARKAKPGEEIGEWPHQGSKDLGVILEASPDWPTSPTTAWFTMVPEGIRESVNWLSKQYGVKKFLIAENGFPSSGAMEDADRSDYIYKHLEQLSLAEKDGLVEIIGYSVWSLIDNFGFAAGYKSKFGLYSVNFDDPMRTRTPRESAHYYSSVIANVTHGLPVVPPSSA